MLEAVGGGEVKKYICFSNNVISRDGDFHRVHAVNLPFLYGVDPAECVFIHNITSLMGMTEDYIMGLIHLNPKSDGSYYDAKEVMI